MLDLFFATVLYTFLLAQAVPAALAQCYYPDGLQAYGDLPCDSDAEHSTCCGTSAGSVCLSNKLCASADGNIIRGSCTDRDWLAPECANYCLGAATGGTDLISCSNVTFVDTSYCCDHTVDCCDTGVGRFDVQPSDPETWARFDRDDEEYIVVGTVFTATTSSAPSGETRAGESTSSLSPSASDQPDSTSDEGGLPTVAMIVIGVGTALVSISVIAVAVLCWMKRSKRRETQEGSPPGPWGHGGEAVQSGSGIAPDSASHENTEKYYYGGVPQNPGMYPPTHHQHGVQDLRQRPP